jgi:hypothetical protein
VHFAYEFSESHNFDNICDVDFLGESFAGVYKMLEFYISLATAATVSHYELTACAESKILSGLNRVDHLFFIVTSKFEICAIFHSVKFARHNNIFGVFRQIVVNHLKDAKNQNINTSDSAYNSGLTIA